jgi:hypothetical protein
MRVASQCFVTVPRKAHHQQVLVTKELVEQHRVPGFDDDTVVNGIGHSRIVFLGMAIVNV